jgi:hypothetical protein
MAEFTDKDVEIYNQLLAKQMEGKALAADELQIMLEYNRALQEREQLLERNKQVVDETTKKTREERLEQAKMDTETKKYWAEHTRDMQVMGEIYRKLGATFREDMVTPFKDLQESWVKWGYEIDKDTGKLRETAGLLGSISRTMGSLTRGGSEGLTGSRNLAGTLSSATQYGMNQIMGTMGGVGGLIGMFMYGKYQEAEFTAVGQRAGQMFDQLAGYTDKFAGHLGGVERALVRGVGPHMAGAVQAVSTSFAESGISAKEAATHIEGYTKFNKDLVTATIAADSALELNHGTFARLAGTLSKDFNIAADTAFNRLWSLAAGAKEAGMNAAQFMNQVMETTSAVRMMNMNVEALGSTQLNYANNLVGRGFRANYAQQYAAQGMANATQAMAGMQTGLSAVIGENLGYGNGLDAWYKMQSGVAGGPGGQKDMLNIMNEAADIMRNATSNRSEQVYGLTKMFGVDVAGAEAMLDVQEAMKSGQEPTKEQMQILNGAFKSEAAKTNSIDRNIEIIKDVIARAAISLLELIVSGLKMIYNLLGEVFIGGGSFSSALEENMRESKALTDQLMKDSDVMAEHFGELGSFYFKNMAKGWGSGPTRAAAPGGSSPADTGAGGVSGSDNAGSGGSGGRNSGAGGGGGNGRSGSDVGSYANPHVVGGSAYIYDQDGRPIKLNVKITGESPSKSMGGGNN